MDAIPLTAYRATDYRVRLPRGGCATIRVDAPLPAALRALVGAQPWAFVTAWNPYSQPTAQASNRRAQHALLAALRQLPGTAAIRPACGVGTDGWREPSLFVVGADSGQLDPLLHGCGQHAYLHGRGSGPARLRLP